MLDIVLHLNKNGVAVRIKHADALSAFVIRKAAKKSLEDKEVTCFVAVKESAKKEKDVQVTTTTPETQTGRR